nr:short-chain dehydrogenase/reductase StrR [Stachybotrys sp.]
MPSPSTVWFITAASSGFGREIALQALDRGHTVIATARNPAKIQDLADAGAHTIAFDVTSPLPTIERVAKDVIDQYGRVDYLVNTAGFITDAAVEEISPEEVYNAFNTNVFGTVNTIHAFLPYMRKQSTHPSGTRGTVVTFGSIGSWEGGPSYAVYSMAKGCMSLLAESLKPELSPFNIVATVVEPGYFRTNFLNADAKVTSKVRLQEYEDENTPSGAVRKRLAAVSNNQPGDVKKGCNVLVDILTRSGVAEGRDVPVRICLGSDADAFIRGKVDKTTALLDDWKDVFTSTDYPKGE